MTKLLLVLGMTSAVTIAGVLMWKVEAAPLVGATNSLAVIESESAVHTAGCMFGTRRCPAGTKWSCTKVAGPIGRTKRAFAGLASSQQRNNRIAGQTTLAMRPSVVFDSAGAIRVRGGRRH